MQYTPMEAILFFLSDNDPAHIKQLKKLTEREILNSYYNKRVIALNKMLDGIAHLKHLKSKADG